MGVGAVGFKGLAHAYVEGRACLGARSALQPSHRVQGTRACHVTRHLLFMCKAMVVTALHVPLLGMT